jgi:YidC/Oxa1 family membrane protein insertase
MTDIRRTILWVIFGFSMVLLWDQWQLHNGKKATFFPKPEVAATVSAPSSASVSAPRQQRLPKPMLCPQHLPQ